MNKEIICPNCGTAFTIDESMYDSIVKQIRNQEFDKEIKEQVKKLKESYDLKYFNTELNKYTIADLITKVGNVYTG